MNKRFFLLSLVAVVAVAAIAVWLGLRKTSDELPESDVPSVSTDAPAPSLLPKRRLRPIVSPASPQKAYNFGTTSTDDSRAQLQEMLVAVDSGNEVRLAEAINQTPSLETDELLEFAAKTYATTDNPGYRRDIVMSLQGQNTRRVLPLLALAARDADPEVRASALLTIGSAFETGRALALDQQINEVESADDELTEEEVAVEKQEVLEEVLTEEDAQTIVDILNTALADEDPEVRQAALQAIERLDGDIQYTTLKSALESSYPEVQLGALGLLVAADNKDAVELMISAMDSPSEELALEAIFQVNHKLTQTFETGDEARAWWKENEKNFTYGMEEKQTEVLDVEKVWE